MSKDSIKELYFIESINGTKNYDSIAGTIDSTSFYHQNNFYYPFKFPIINPKKITLKSVELPIGSSAPINIKSINGTSSFTITYSRGTDLNVYRQLTVPNGTYTTTSLVAAINTSITGAALPGAPAIKLTIGIKRDIIRHLLYGN